MQANETRSQKLCVRARVESFISYGQPACDMCREFSQSERGEKGEYFPNQPVHYIRGGKDSAHEFWGITLCSQHDQDKYTPCDATHRVIDDPKYVGDSHRMNSAYEHRVVGVEEL